MLIFYVRPLTDLMTEHGFDDSTEDWIVNFAVPVSFEDLTPTKKGFREIPPTLFPLGLIVKNTFPRITRLQIISQ